MTRVRVLMEEFVTGDLDFSGLQQRLAEAAAAGATREEAVHALQILNRAESLSPAVLALLRRSVDRHFSGDDTDPFPRIRPSEERAAERTRDETAAEDDDLPPMFAAQAVEVASPAERSPADPGRDEPSPGPTREEPGPPGPAPDARSAPEPPPEEEPEPPPKEEPEPEPEGLIAGRYVPEGLIGRGGVGLVYRALDRCRVEAGLEEVRVALKMLRPDLEDSDEARRRLLVDGFRGAELRHENVVRVMDVGDVGGEAYVVMELLDGDNLRNTILRHSPDGLPRDEALRVLEGIAGGLAFLHGRGLVHGDLKPGNVFVNRDGCPKLLDFGTGVRQGHGQEPTLEGGALPGRTPAYASPEVLGGGWPQPSDDVFSLGCLACELLTSKHPFGRIQADEAREQRLKPVLPATVSGRRRRALAKALRFSGRRRFRDASAFLAAMDLGKRERRRAGLVTALLAGLGLGVILVLAIIHPAGPLAKLMPQARPQAGGPGDTPAAAVRDEEPAVPQREEVPPPGVNVAGRFITTEPVAGEDGAPSPASPDARSSEPAPAAPAEQAGAVPPPRPAGPGRLEFSAAEYRVTEGAAVVIATVVRRNGTDGVVSFRWRTTAGTATADADYVESDWQQVEIPAGAGSTRLYVPLVDDGIAEDEETFFLELSDPGGGAALGPTDRLQVRITDDEG